VELLTQLDDKFVDEGASVAPEDEFEDEEEVDEGDGQGGGDAGHGEGDEEDADRNSHFGQFSCGDADRARVDISICACVCWEELTDPGCVLLCSALQAGLPTSSSSSMPAPWLLRVRFFMLRHMISHI
jgi:hypothetical protein